MSLAPTDSTLPFERLVCARCGTSFECGASAGACWCMDEAYRLLPPSQLALQEKIKAALDPKGLLNPGKLVRRQSARFA